MKHWKVLVFVLVFGIVFLGCNGNGGSGVYAQSSNNEQRLIGKWTNSIDGSITVVFNADGSMSGLFDYSKYFIAGDKLLLFSNGKQNGIWLKSTDIYDLRISTDGRTLIIIDASNYGTAFKKST